MIFFDKETGLFNISTENSSYIMGLTADGILTHIYYGKKLSEFLVDGLNFCEPDRKEFTIMYSQEYSDVSLTRLYQEYPTFGGGDYRTPAFNVTYSDYSRLTELLYSEHKIFNGKPKLNGLPCIYSDTDNESTTLQIVLKDRYSGIKVTLSYSVIDGFDAIMRSSEIDNGCEDEINIYSALSASFDCENTGYELTYLSGAWTRERNIKKTDVSYGNFFIDSKRGASGHSLNPFIALSKAGASEDCGEVYGLSLIYSGNFIAGVESDDDSMRVYMGINPFDFCYVLSPGEKFQTPEAVLVYSSKGFGNMSRSYHRLYREHLCKKEFRNISRPVLINHWEATYYDYNEEKILDIAKKAAECGIDLMVLDDGWFGTRNDEKTSLGDWVVNKNKLPSGIDGLAKKINQLGMTFGLWFEPEMVSPDSNLFREHPDWVLGLPNKKQSLSRNELILDLSRADVCDYIAETISKILNSANISYVKWDMNRNMSNVGSFLLEGQHQGEVAHRYILGLYSILERLTNKFPNILFEGCSGGGGRFDPGIMYYMPQSWTSDNTDAVDRLFIQYGTSLVYPPSTMGAHVSTVPNHQVGRTTPLNMRGLVAMNGRLGYELDLNKLSDLEIEEVKSQIELYRKYEKIVHCGDMYRLISPYETDAAAFQYISSDKRQVLVFYFNIKGISNVGGRLLTLKDLDLNANYKNVKTGQVLSGEVLSNAGITLPRHKDYISMSFLFEKQIQPM